ncbi:PEP/pyruvate-binding domain-containing protein [Desulfohalovibrio reitneri]|uniref:PEP/pyruvate-binding domain-containing protein n=1 Tax=Desulfohalovibrio reitneri TaxID=1307759 RepID=UPI0006910F74|nr:PEP/pyruvate-binding domain-containing protein [Desulfohalovibrio reitneri]
MGLLNRLLGSRKTDPDEAGRLRLEFRKRYHWFKRLIRANRATLEGMAEIQEMLRWERPFSMVRARTVCARVSLETWKIVDAMTNIAPSRYDVLSERFAALKAGLEERLEPIRHAQDGPLVLPLAEIGLDRTMEVGGKAAVLGEMAGPLGLNTPGGFAITASGFARFMAHNELDSEIESRIRAASPSHLDELYALQSELYGLVMAAELPAELTRAMEEAVERTRQAFDQGRAAVRSSALVEDLPGASFAGLHRSLLNVELDELGRAYKEVVGSLFSLPAMTYRFERGIPDEDAVMCVIVLGMQQARSGGVLYTANPVDGSREVVVNSVWGLPKGVVDGRCRPDVFTVRDGEVDVCTGDKVCAYQPLDEEGVARRPVGEDLGGEPSLTREEVLTLAEVGRRLEERFQGPLDVEWLIDTDGKLVLLQCRPLHIAFAEESSVESPAREPLYTGGVAASPGVAGGPVKVVRRAAQELNFPQGAVLVAPQALPRLASLMGRASAVVAGTGSVTGHLASVCREFGVPALFGLPEAVEELADGQEITVDGRAGTILPGPPPPEAATARPDLGQSAPVRELLARAAELITPLHLTDPSSISFRAGNVATYHDITRFCHEKAVEEMFRFGRDHHFPERSSKRLYTHAPTQWWVLNLDDGFRQEVEGKFVRLEDIACLPMLALWSGVAFEPWQGPPRLDTGGFMSVMFRSTTDPSLVAGARPKQTERNYFMISREYCSLTSRLGYHFCTVEALVGQRPGENHAAFSFQGGAADDERRHMRVRLIGSILEERGFQVEIRGDVLRSSVQGLEAEAMYDALRVLGYLTIHTRQIDMAMANQAETRRLTENLRQGLDRLLAQAGGRAPDLRAAEPGGDTPS